MKIWEFFENLNSIAYAIDLETYEVVYLNKIAREFCAVDGIPGDMSKCNELFHGKSMPCENCEEGSGAEGKFNTLELSIPNSDKKIKAKSSKIVDNGKNYCITFGIEDIDYDSEVLRIKDLERLNKEKVRLEELANQGIREALMEDSSDDAIMKLLEFLGTTLGAERTYIFERNSRGNDDNTYEWCADGVEPAQYMLWDLPKEVCANWYDNFEEGKNIVIKNLEDIKETDPLQYDNLKRQDIHSLVVVPIYNRGKIFGFYGVDNPPAHTLEYSQNMLQILAHFIVSQLRQRNIVRNLYTISRKDQLTGLGNRFAMSDFVSVIYGEESIGIVYCDITGLKYVNDNEGHVEGDKLIIRCAECLKSVFGENCIFRIGGDEFLVLNPNIDEEKFRKKVNKLRSSVGMYNVNMSIGEVWVENKPTDISSLLNIAEKFMYEDKAKYYEKAKIERRK